MLARIGRSTGIPAQYRRPLAVGLPIAYIYLTRWKGTQSTGNAILTMAIPILMTLYIAKNRSRLEERFSSWYVWRDRKIPRIWRLVLVVTVPILIAFVFIHGAPTDIVAFFGGKTSSRTSVSERSIRILLGTALSTASVFLLANEPQERA